VGTETNKTENILGINLLELRSARNINQDIIASALGISPGAYSSWERGRTQPSIEDLIKLARYFGVSVDRLLRFESRALRIGSYISAIDNFHPIKNTDGIFLMIYAMVFNHLYHYDIYERKFHVELIDSWSSDIVKSTYTFYLKKDVKFHSGDPLDPEDVKLSYELYIQVFDFYNNFIDSVNVVDGKHAIELKLKPGRWLELDELPAPYIIPRSYIRADSEECFDGTGPYKITDTKQQNQIREHLNQPVVIESNNAYFGKVASIQFVEFQLIQEPQNLEDSLDKGEIDLAYEVDPRRVDADRFNIERGKGTIAYYLVLTQNNELCRDENFRKAIDFALDRKALIDALGLDNTEFLPDQHLYLVLSDAIYENGRNRYNEAEAKASWEKAKASFSKSGVKDFTVRIGSSLEFGEFMSGFIREIVNQLKKIGIEAIDEPDWHQANALVQPVGFQKIPMIYKNLHSHDDPESCGVPWVYKNTYLDRLLEDFEGMTTYREVQRILSAEQIFLPLFRRGISVAYTKDLLTNHRIHATNLPYGPDAVYWEFKS
jgi:ABC-type transport system substrate-binding protein